MSLVRLSSCLRDVSSKYSLSSRSLAILAHHQQSQSFPDSRGFLHQPQAVRISWLKPAIIEVLPITAEVISSRGRSLDSLAIAVSYCPSLPPVLLEEDEDKNASSNSSSSTATPVLGKRRIDDSWIEIVLPFSQHSGLRDSLVKSDGKTLRYDKLFEILDGLASDVSYRHCAGIEGLGIVTASVDEMHVNGGVKMSNDLKLQGYLTYVGKSSMEVTIDMISIDPHGTAEFIGESKFIMVSRKNNKAASIYGLVLANEAAEERFRLGHDRSIERKRRAANSLQFKPPLPEEIHLVHQLYLQSKQKTEKMLAGTTSNVNPADVALMNEEHVWMKNTVFKNTHFMHLQNRNIHGKVFGGYIMRAAYELGWVAAACFMGQENAEFVYVDDIQFVKSVNIGSIMEFSAVVAYNTDEYVVVKVNVVDVSPVNIVRTKTNDMTYVFKKKEKGPLPKVLPVKYEEIVTYVEGKRSLDQLLGTLPASQK